MLKLIVTILIVSFTANTSSFAANDQASLEKAVSQLELAKHYIREQQHEKAFETFLGSLQPNLEIVSYIPTLDEMELYQKALASYFNSKGAQFYSGTDQLIADYAPLVENHPDYAELAFIVAAAYANRGEFLRHFDLFYRAYHRLPTHYFAYKTQAILWIKLFECTHPGRLKEKRREQIIKHLAQALEVCPTDTSLYRLIILYAQDEKRFQIITESLNKIIRENIIIPRVELEFYIENAQSIKDRDLTQRFIDKASVWHPGSRIVAKAQLELKTMQN